MTTKASILLVDDTPANLVALKAILEPLGEDLVTASSGAEALRLLLRREFALILLDVRMAEIDGIETARLIRTRARTAGVPIIFLTAFDRAEADMAAAYELGAADFIFKPFRPDALRAKVSTFVELFHKTQAIREQAEQLRELELREHRRQLREVEREREVALQTGMATVADLAGSLNPADVLERVLSRSVAAVHAHQGVLLRVDSDGALWILDSHDVEERPGLPRGEPFPSLPVLRQALIKRQPVLNGGVAPGGLDPAAMRWLDGARHTAALPLRVADETRALILLARRGGDRFAEEEVEALSLIANIAAVALRNAELYVQAEAASVSKSEFLNMAAHELRTPLSVVNGYLSMLSDGSLGEPGPAWRRPVEILNEKAAELNQLVDALLMAARVEAGTIHGQPEVVDLGEAALDAVRRAEPRAHLLEARLEVDAPAVPVTVLADAGHIGRILDNLINNALTYSAGPPAVVVRVGELGEVEVEDRGLGVPEERREAIFERFYRVNDPSLPPQPGTGLGLYLSRELARRNGGELALARSVPGEGSVFRLNLPPVGVAQTAAAEAAV